MRNRFGQSGTGQPGFTLVEVVIGMAVALLILGGVWTGYWMSVQRAQWSADALAAHTLALQRLEQVRSARWEPRAIPETDEITPTNFPDQVEPMNLSSRPEHLLMATTTTLIRWVSTNPPLKLIQVECRWPYRNRLVYTSTMATYRAPDQ
ncbi:MAG TPA: prepilin-type N-terminal cleavage/methylation domain-containing protein [Candidatus Paceibacterota bacterium]|nr:prepilin-type N-terminal cleavage/methylation domain-containing protein [Verrucomicrobiota bacterium]HOX03566.1 prepilin-type N-terminal cleavage/methylation domain-containing protein [Verrucomicrobiota bacterium]HRZ46455.1 prepilin-type N-terminal cleavage/methylation domain-containing protein [Candidatus Paceibacterota bacterium]HRZ91919.1 prepilin-type N-terminal cleavage/methylation domain-containing protein [Candidatus Paceibacterota bacterium]